MRVTSIALPTHHIIIHRGHRPSGKVAFQMTHGKLRAKCVRASSYRLLEILAAKMGMKVRYVSPAGSEAVGWAARIFVLVDAAGVSLTTGHVCTNATLLDMAQQVFTAARQIGKTPPRDYVTEQVRGVRGVRGTILIDEFPAALTDTD